MKRTLHTCLGIGMLLCGSLTAYHGEDMNPFEVESYGIIVADQEITRHTGEDSTHHRRHSRHHKRHHGSDNGDFSFDNGDSSSDSSGFGHDKFTGAKVEFGEAHIGLRYYYFCSGCCEAYMIGGGYTYTRLRWDNNPFFKQRNYSTATLDLGARLGCICDWEIDNFVRTSLDTESPNDHYIFFDILSWARLKHRPNLGINVGALIFTGMKVNRFYPIFGIDWRPTPNLQINMVYPLKMNITYTFDNNLFLAVGGRLIYSRHRVREQDKYEDFNREGIDKSHAFQYFGDEAMPVPLVPNFPPDNFPVFLNPRNFARAIWEYRAYGIEGMIGYNCADNINVKVFGGWSFMSHLTIGAHGFNHKQTYNLKASPYIGAEFLLRF